METLVRSCLYNWLGYGNPNGRIWFIGTEEGGAEIFRQKTKTLGESLNIRKNFELSMDFRKVWEEYYEIPLSAFRGPTVWRYMAAFLLSFSDEDFSSKEIRNYIFKDKKLGTCDADHFMCELLPLPKKSKHDIYPYTDVWSSIQDYHTEVIPKRFSLIKRTIEENENINLIICYEKLLTERIKDYFKGNMELDFKTNYKKEVYYLYKLRFPQGRKILFLSTPFFGNGRISYDGIRYISNIIKKRNY